MVRWLVRNKEAHPQPNTRCSSESLPAFGMFAVCSECDGVDGIANCWKQSHAVHVKHFIEGARDFDSQTLRYICTKPLIHMTYTAHLSSTPFYVHALSTRKITQEVSFSSPHSSPVYHQSNPKETNSRSERKCRPGTLAVQRRFVNVLYRSIANQRPLSSNDKEKWCLCGIQYMYRSERKLSRP